MSPGNLEIIRLNNLKLSARLISEQLKQGVHSGKKVGVGSEFEQYRHYQAGDDPKRIDWKYFSRSGKHMIKESQTESHLGIRLMLDLSGSMNYEEEGIKRLDYAKNLLASLAFLGRQQGDSLSFFTIQEGEIIQKVAPSPKSFQRILYQLETGQATGTLPLSGKKIPVLNTREKELIIVVSDFLQRESEWLDMVKQLRHPRKEIVLFQILGKQEQDFEMKGNYRFQDLEGSGVMTLDAAAVAKRYNSAIRHYLQEFEDALVLPQVHLYRVNLQDSIIGLISRFLAERQFT